MIEDDGFETVHVTVARMPEGMESTALELIWVKEGYDSWGTYGHWYKDSTGGGIKYTRSDIPRNTIQDALNLLALGDNTQARAVLEAYLREGK